MAEREARADRRARLWIALVIAIGVVARLAVLRSPGFPSDVATFQAWAERLAALGPARFYEPGYFSDYPPGFLFVLWPLGVLLDGELLRLAVKAASIPADIGIAIVCAAVAWRAAGRRAGILAAALWMLAPGPIFAGPFWGQVDAVGTLPLLGALVMAGRARWAWAGLLAGTAAMIKPQFGIGLVIVLAAASIEWIRYAEWRAPLRSIASASLAVAGLGLPFRTGPAELVGLVRSAAETYAYTSLYAFNVWSVVADFWTPDDAYVVIGGALLAAGLVASCAPLWARRDVAMLLAAGTLAAAAFYFLPTRAHERYLFPAFALLLPLAAVRTKLLVPYVILALSYAVTLYFAFTRYPQNDLRSPAWLEETLFSRNGQIAIALVMLAVTAYVAWRLARGDATLASDRESAPVTGAPPAEGVGAAGGPPALLRPGGVPSRRDLAAAFLVALVVLLSRGYRLDHPREMYFDEVYHARTAFELLAERPPYEWTHPHLAKELMALGILGFADDRVVGAESAPRDVVAFAAANDGTRAFVTSDVLLVRARDGTELARVGLGNAAPEGVAFDDEEIVLVTRDAVLRLSRSGKELARSPHPAGVGAVRGIAIASGRMMLAGPDGLAFYESMDAPPRAVARGAVAVTAKPDGTQFFALDANATVRILDGSTAQELSSLSLNGAGRAIAYVEGPNHLFIARSDTPAIDVVDLAARSPETVPLANRRTGSFAAAATALAVVPRTRFLYALADGRAVVIEPNGASPYAAIRVASSARALGIDGDGDKLLVLGDEGVERIESGRHAFAWRLPGVVFAAILAFFVVLLARRLFAAPLVAHLAGALVVLDGSMFAQARIGMNDVYVTTLIVAAWYFIVAAHRPRRAAWLDVVLAGVLIGLGAAAKWAAVYALAGILVASLAVTAYAYERGRPGGGGPLDLLGGRGRNAVLLFVSFAVIPAAVYLGSYLPWFGGSMTPYGWDLRELTQQMFWYHSSLTTPHCASSPWWSWPLDLKPVYWYYGPGSGGFNGYIYDAGNPVLFWLALPAAAIVAGLAIRWRSAAMGVVAFAMLAQFVAWVPISRVLFFYHFFNTLPFYLLCLAIVLSLAWQRGRRSVMSVLAVAAAVSVLFYPFVSGVPIPGDLAGAYFILPTWQYDPAFSPTDSCPNHVSSSIASSLTVGVAWAYELAAAALFVAVALDLRVARRVLARIGV